MPDVVVLATPEAYEQLSARLEDVSSVIAKYLGPALNKPSQNIKLRLIFVRTEESVANVHFEVARTDHNMTDEERYEMQEACIRALHDAWLAIEQRQHVRGVKTVDGTATISKGTWGKVWQLSGPKIN